jgi:hypothetical protein
LGGIFGGIRKTNMAQTMTAEENAGALREPDSVNTPAGFAAPT